MRTLHTSQYSPQEHDDPTTPEQLIEAILAVVDLEEDDLAASEIYDAVEDLLTEDESIEEFTRYNERDEQIYRLGEEVCIYVPPAGVLCCGTVAEHAASDVASFREYIAEREADLDEVSSGSAA
jgi:hypothetical protein